VRFGEPAVPTERMSFFTMVGRSLRTAATVDDVALEPIVDFHDDPALTMLFLSDAGGVGLNLQRAASCCINLELPWNPAVIEQRIGRIYRLGQTMSALQSQSPASSA
jgi:hypothetical protein